MKPEGLNTARLEAFSDAVLAIIITIMVIEFRPPEGSDFTDLIPVIPIFLSYILSFLYLAIYWNNHHHLLRAGCGVTARIMWSNMFLLFCLSLIPFVTSWLGEHPHDHAPNVVYGIVLLLAAMGYFTLQTSIAKNLGPKSDFVKHLGKDIKGKVSPILYVLAIVFGLYVTWIAQLLFVVVALMWVVPDRRLERSIHAKKLLAKK